MMKADFSVVFRLAPIIISSTHILINKYHATMSARFTPG